MAPRLSLLEQDFAFAVSAKGKTVADIYEALYKRRAAKNVGMVKIIVARRFLRGKTHKRGRVEARGSKRSLTRRNVMAMDKARRNFIDKTKGTRQATWDLTHEKGRAPMAHRTTMVRLFARCGVDVKLRRCREEPGRTAAMEKEPGICVARCAIGLSDDIDLIMDNKKFEVPTTLEARV